MNGYRLTYQNGVTIDTDEDGRVVARSDGPAGWKYGGKWRIVGIGKRWHSRFLVSLASAAQGEDIGHGRVHDIDHGTRRIQGRRVVRVQAIDIPEEGLA